MSDKRKQHYTGDEEVIRHNMERSREVIEARKHRNDEDDSSAPFVEDMPKPETAREDLQDVPIGGQTGPNFAGGTAKRHKAG